MRLEFDWEMVTAYDVIAKLEGSEYPDEWVIRGNHHDGWNHGAADPLSGLVAMLDEARSVAQLAKAGNRPARTIIYAAWDAEEPGLIGSLFKKAPLGTFDAVDQEDADAFGMHDAGEPGIVDRLLSKRLAGGEDEALLRSCPA